MSILPYVAHIGPAHDILSAHPLEERTYIVVILILPVSCAASVARMVDLIFAGSHAESRQKN
jgi:hypothetical protein